VGAAASIRLPLPHRLGDLRGYRGVRIVCVGAWLRRGSLGSPIPGGDEAEVVCRSGSGRIEAWPRSPGKSVRSRPVLGVVHVWRGDVFGVQTFAWCRRNRRERVCLGW
jgi:hypothetical protein